MNVIVTQWFIIAILAIWLIFQLINHPKKAGALVINKKNPEFDNYLIRIDIPFEELEKKNQIELKVVVEK